MYTETMDETEDIKPVGIVTFDLDEAEALLDDVAFVREYVEDQKALVDSIGKALGVILVAFWAIMIYKYLVRAS